MPLFCSDRIAAIGDDNEITEMYKSVAIDETIDASGCCILPGLSSWCQLLLFDDTTM
jgi:predicted amidohydrolase YtcJ